jgi:hypothetical protein
MLYFVVPQIFFVLEKKEHISKEEKIKPPQFIKRDGQIIQKTSTDQLVR